MTNKEKVIEKLDISNLTKGELAEYEDYEVNKMINSLINLVSNLNKRKEAIEAIKESGIKLEMIRDISANIQSKQ